MKKELKDFLHLYLGCEVEYQGANGRYKEFMNSSSSNDDYNFIGTLCSYNLDGQILVSTETNEDIELFLTDIKPILRPLSDMTGDELIQYGKIEFPDMKGSFDLKGIREVAMHAYYEPETFKWLLSKNFDLFELIEAGLAIDSTKLTSHANS